MKIQSYQAASHPDCPHTGYSENCPCTPGGATILINGNEAMTVAQAAEQVQVRGAGGSPYTVTMCDDSHTTGAYSMDGESY